MSEVVVLPTAAGGPRSPARPVLLCSTASDSHTWNLVHLEMFVREHGLPVRNLGPCVPDRLLLESCRALRPSLVVLSSVNGHGAVDGARAIARLRADPVCAGLTVIIGGRLGTDGGAHAGSRRDALLRAGFDDVLEGPDALAVLSTRLLLSAPPVDGPGAGHLAS